MGSKTKKKGEGEGEMLIGCRKEMQRRTERGGGRGEDGHDNEEGGDRGSMEGGRDVREWGLEKENGKDEEMNGGGEGKKIDSAR